VWVQRCYWMTEQHAMVPQRSYDLDFFAVWQASNKSCLSTAGSYMASGQGLILFSQTHLAVQTQRGSSFLVSVSLYSLSLYEIPFSRIYHNLLASCWPPAPQKHAKTCQLKRPAKTSMVSNGPPSGVHSPAVNGALSHW
jgi:hypothetical protein